MSPSTENGEENLPSGSTKDPGIPSSLPPELPTPSPKHRPGTEMQPHYSLMLVTAALLPSTACPLKVGPVMAPGKQETGVGLVFCVFGVFFLTLLSSCDLPTCVILPADSHL